ncbi:MAG: hypothetical protein KDI36_16660 [Pseudomonadales bacterium]|nr:hypothetical protein [Pseudomonadales bacterium]
MAFKTLSGYSLATALTVVLGVVWVPEIYAGESLCRDPDAPVIKRRRPGERARAELPLCPQAPVVDENTPGIKPWVDPFDLGPALPDRWRIVEEIGITTNLLDPYSAHNPLKGDLPVWGDDWFYSIIAISDTVIEPRSFPIPVGAATTARPGSLDTIGSGDTTIFSQSFIIENVIYKGDTVFRPPDWEFRFTPVFNINEVHADEKGVLKVDPDSGGSGGRKRQDTFTGVQALFADKHLRNVSDRFDFDSIRIGIQPFSSDFRGFLFQDSQLGVRLFGTRSNNRFQYNLAWFRRLEKDTNSGLNDVNQSLRDDDVFAANVYWQDFLKEGFFSQATVIHNRNRESGEVEYDKNGFIQRPSSLFEERFARDYDVTYFGYNGDGHIDRVNLTVSAYYAYGQQDSTRIRGAEEDIRAWFMAAEASMDFDWFRPKLSFLWASGDDDPFDREANGFDAIFENPQFAGADTSFLIRQNVPFIGGGGVALMGRNGILPSLRPSKEQGQSNFINPGIRMIGIGADADLYPQLRVSANWNYFEFDTMEVIERLRQQGNMSADLGHDVSVSLTWRPFMSQNVVVRLSGAALLGGDGFDDLYGREADMPYSVLTNIILTY